MTVLRAIVRRVTHVVPVLLLVTFGTIVLVDLVPGDPAFVVLGDSGTPEQVDRIHEELGFDQPLPVRYVSWLGQVFTGDFGTTLVGDRPVLDVITERLPVTLQLSIMALVMALLIAIPAAMYAAYRQGRAFDRASNAVTSAVISSPPFMTALVLVFLFSLTYRVFPVTGWVSLTEAPLDNLHHAFLPALSLALFHAPIFMRLLRSDLIATLQEDFIMSARAKGMPTRYILLRHALRPSSLSLVTIAGITLGRLLGGTVIIEVLFGLPGLGQRMIGSILDRDLQLVQGIVLFVAVVYIILNLAVDVFYFYLDPRVRPATS